MSEGLSKGEQLLMWELFAAGGAKLLKDIVPVPKGTPHRKLARKSFLKSLKRERLILLELEDRGWRWIADSDPFPIAANEKRVTSERRLLQSLMRGVKRYAAENNTTIQSLFRIAPQIPPEKERKARPRREAKQDADPQSALQPSDAAIEKEISDAFFEIAGRPASGNIRLSALRSKLNHIERTRVDAALISMWKAKTANLMGLDNPRDIDAEQQAALKSGIHTFHVAPP